MFKRRKFEFSTQHFPQFLTFVRQGTFFSVIVRLIIIRIWNLMLNVHLWYFSDALARAGSIIDINYVRQNVSSVYGIDNVECRGTETSLRDCPYVSGANIDCSGIDEYASVTCTILNNAPPSRRSLSLSLIILYINAIFFLSIIYINKKLIKMSISSKKAASLLYYLQFQHLSPPCSVIIDA